MKRRKRAAKIAVSAAVILIALGGVAYKLADRYLIEHIEVRVANAQAASSSSAPAATAASAVSDDWSYESDDKQISIRKVQTGAGDDMITYYVADVVLKNGATLQTAFAKDAYGTNITQATSTIAANHGAVFAINGDYYGFRNDGVIIRGGTLYRDEPAREGFAVLSDGTMKSYDETEEDSASLLAAGVTDTFSFGPALVKDGVAIDNFDDVKIDTNFGNRTIDGSNPRTGIGMIAPNHYVFVVVDGRQADSRGMTLNEFADLFASLGATEAYNLDGGGSSTMYFNGRVVNDPQGKEKERGVSDIIYLPG